MKILLVCDGVTRRDGWGIYAAGLSAGLHAKGDTVVTTTGLGTPVSYLANPFRAYRESRILKRLIALEKPDVVHFIVEPYATALPFLPRKLPPVVLTVHGTYSYFPHLLRNPFKRKVAEWVTRGFYTRANRIVCVSKYTKHFLLERLSLPEKKLIVIPNGVDLKGKSIQPHIGNRKEILFVGGVKARKGVLETLDLVAAYRASSGENFRFTVIGSLTDEPWYVEKVRTRIRELNLEERVVLTGAVAEGELAEAYERADALIMLSISDGREFEGFGLVYLEANAYGVPVIGAQGTAAEDAIKSGCSGYLVDPQSPTEGATALRELLVAGEPLRASARRWAEEHNWANIAEEYQRVYRTPV